MVLRNTDFFGLLFTGSNLLYTWSSALKLYLRTQTLDRYKLLRKKAGKLSLSFWPLNLRRIVQPQINRCR